MLEKHRLCCILTKRVGRCMLLADRDMPVELWTGGADDPYSVAGRIHQPHVVAKTPERCIVCSIDGSCFCTGLQQMASSIACSLSWFPSNGSYSLISSTSGLLLLVRRGVRACNMVLFFIVVVRRKRVCTCVDRQSFGQHPARRGQQSPVEPHLDTTQVGLSTGCLRSDQTCGQKSPAWTSRRLC